MRMVVFWEFTVRLIFPDDHYYGRSFTSHREILGLKVWETRYAKIGIGICWDQWFQKPSSPFGSKWGRIAFYPTAIGSEPILDTDSQGHWQRTMQGHDCGQYHASHCTNRIGLEESSHLTKMVAVIQPAILRFLLMTDETGEGAL